MVEYILIDNKKFNIKMLVEETEFDYYTDIYIELTWDNKKILLLKDNLLAVKNIMEKYDGENHCLNVALDERNIGLLLNEYYRNFYEEYENKTIILNDDGQWIGEIYCIFTALSCATWIYKYNDNIILKVTPIFRGFEEDEFTEKYTKFRNNYKDIFRETITLQDFRGMKDIIIKLYDKLM